jgi:hypothetical protein
MATTPTGVVRLKVVDGCLIVVQSTGAMSDEAFFGGVLKALREECRGMFIFRGIGEPNLSATQRAAMTQTVKDQNVRVAALVESAIARGVVTAMSWVFPYFKAFKPEDVARALEHLGTDPDSAAEVIRTLDELTADVLANANT